MPARGDVLRIESLLAQAHRRVWLAAQVASDFPDHGLHDDLQLIYVELERINMSLLKDRPYRRASPS